jgi:hypothetical protein|nr:MAG TPA: hypothetical protein [Caudoviricetes sp.]
MLNTKIIRNDQEVTVAKLRGVVKTITRTSEIEGMEWSVFADRIVAQRDAMDSLGGDQEAVSIIDDAPDGQNWSVVFTPVRGRR